MRKKRARPARCVVGDPSRNRTCGLRFRKPSLYPAELWDRTNADNVPDGQGKFKAGKDGAGGAGPREARDCSLLAESESESEPDSDSDAEPESDSDADADARLASLASPCADYFASMYIWQPMSIAFVM